jgi:LCP family protein required for cell wall assembly
MHGMPSRARRANDPTRQADRGTGAVTTAGPSETTGVIPRQRDGDGPPPSGPPPNSSDGASAAPPPRRHRRRRGRRILLITLLALGLLMGGGTLAGGLYLRSVEGVVERVDAFHEVPAESRPDKVGAAKGALNFLVLGSDTRDPANTSGSRSDTIILAHLPHDRSSAQVISIPRDTWVHIPKSADGRHGNTNAKINAAFAWGGIPLMVQTVEAYTGVRIDHVVVVDFSGFKEIVDALGGVEIDVEESFTSTHSLTADGQRHFTQGPQTMDGAAALDYARERFAFTDGDFARIRHQQQVIRAIVEKASSRSCVPRPIRWLSTRR